LNKHLYIVIERFKSKVCPTCGCSLVRLGIKETSATKSTYKNESYSFCCSGWAEIFDKNPSKYIEEIKNVTVCPVCLAEKNIVHTTEVKYKNIVIPFCRCPHCISTFKEKPEYYLDRLIGKIEYEGLFNNLCC